ncbi:CBS domain-containing protein [Planctomycetota bacterium]
MGLFENMTRDSVGDLNMREPVLVRPDETVRSVVKLLHDQRIGCAILVDDDKKPIGMFTESMLSQLVIKNPSAIDEPVGTHAAKRWPQVCITDKVASVLDALEVKNTRFLAVVDEEGRVCGLAGQKGLMEYVAEHFPNQVMVQRMGQKTQMQHREGA